MTCLLKVILNSYTFQKLYKQHTHALGKKVQAQKRPAGCLSGGPWGLKKEAAYLAGFQAFTKSMHWVISGTLVSQLC